MLKDGQKDIITIKSNGNKQTYHVAASICSSKSNSIIIAKIAVV